MTKTIKYLITFSILATVFLVLVFCYVKLHVIENCLFTSDSSTTSISVSKKTHNMIDTVAVKTCHIEINEAKYKAWLTFKDQESDKYVY
jgi:hypothetical protein